jgi:hypothetical protein
MCWTGCFYDGGSGLDWIGLDCLGHLLVAWRAVQVS